MEFNVSVAEFCFLLKVKMGDRGRSPKNVVILLNISLYVITHSYTVTNYLFALD
jgi:hypothetical protein